jgi:foldase protein PrsA
VVLNKFAFIALLICVAAAGAGVLALVEHFSGIVATVNGESISKEDMYQAMYGQIGSPTLDQLVVKLLVEQEAKKAGVSVSDAELQAEIQKLIDEQYGSEDMFAATLQYYGMTREAFEDQWRTYLTAQKILKPTVSVSDQDIQAYFEAHHEELNQKESVTLRQIVTATKDEAAEVLKELRSGANFADLARQKSTDTVSRDNGGELGKIYLGDLPSDVEAVVFALKVGEFSEPVQVDGGFAVFNVTEKTEAREVTLDEVKDKVQELVLEEKIQTALPDWLSQIRSQADIRYR